MHRACAEDKGGKRDYTRNAKRQAQPQSRTAKPHPNRADSRAHKRIGPCGLCAARVIGFEGQGKAAQKRKGNGDIA